MRSGIALVCGVLFAALAAIAPAQADADVDWLCKPGIADNPCEIGQDTTYQEGNGSSRVDSPPTGPREVDCFYVYPTVSNQLTPNATKSRDPELKSIAKFHAARFSSQCRVFAPIYRQATLASILTGILGLPSAVDRELPYADVLEAWREYLRTENRGRGVVLLGHSQGTFVLRRLLREEIEVNSAQEELLVSALLLGGNVTVRAGQTSGGDFARTPLCTAAGQFGCVVAYSSFFADPSPSARFGRAEAGLEVACTDPRPLAGISGPLRTVTPSELFAPGTILLGIIVTALGLPPSAATTWVSPPDLADGSCQTINGAHVLRLDPLPGSRRPTWYPEPGWGTHLIDFNVALDPLVTLVGRQAGAWQRRADAAAVSPAVAGVAAKPSRRCARGGKRKPRRCKRKHRRKRGGGGKAKSDRSR